LPQVYNKSRPYRPERRHTTATGVLPSSQEVNLTRLPTGPSTVPIQYAADTEPQPVQSHDIEQAITPGGPPAVLTTPSPNQLEPQQEEQPKRGFISRKILKFRRRRHHPATEQAYKKSIWGNFKAILFSSWINVLLVFVPVV